MITWSLCMIVKNEEQHLDYCLKSVKDLFDEIIIVDTGSTDKTKLIAKKYTNKIYNFKWIDDFSAARNYAFSKATKDYIMWLDADDIIKKDDYQNLKKLKKEMNNNIDVIMLKYNTSFDSNGKPNFSYYRERILKREKNYQWQDRVHEFISISGNIIKKEIAITHQPLKKEHNDRNLKIYQEMFENNEKFTPRNLYYFARELNDHDLPKKSIRMMKRFLQTKKGWIEDNINACIIIHNNYLKLNKKELALEYLFKTFIYDTPRSKPCSLIGNYYLDQKDYQKAIYWYQLAITTSTDDTKGFYEKEYRDFIPIINLSLCYYETNDIEKSHFYHNLLKKDYHNHPLVIHNDKYFNK